ncbi:substrate-binding and vWA domain-containing protein [Kribbella monticola]|uniref:substrate-binding and vWA domain-containing protein n=1 Tax=Kribbella monticola TaxID=2185285 RepID=UPI000DD3ED9B|nr:substrate-binding and VWA domain-containing protein [Kribbella monticola]
MSSTTGPRRFHRGHLLGLVVGLALIAATAIGPRQVAADGNRAGEGGNGATVAPCRRTEAIQVSSSTEKAVVMSRLADRYNSAGRAVGDLCGKIELTPLTSGATKNALAAGMKDPPEVWLPTSSMWLRLLEQEGHGDLIARDPAPQSITTSTLVIAMPQSVVEALEKHGKRLKTWADVLELSRSGWSAYGKPAWGKFILGRDNAETSTSGLAATVATYIAAPGELSAATLNDPQVVHFVHGIESSVARYGDEAVRFMQQIYDAEQRQDATKYRPYVDAVVIQEQMAYLYNRGAPGGDPAKMSAERVPRNPLRVVHPEDGTLELDHPYVVLASATPDQRAIARDFYQFLIDPVQQKEFANVGFRPRDDATKPTEQLVHTLGVPADQHLNFVQPPDGKLLAAMVNSWDKVRRKTRVLLVLDVSGSMNEIADDPNRAQDPTKLQLLIPAAQRALDLLDDDDEVGLWTFSSDPPYTQVMPVSRVGAVRAQLKARIQHLKASGNTALYAVTDAASQMMARSLDPERINAIVLLSDGQNTENYPGGAKALLDRLNPAGRDTSVRIFTVPYGKAENADVATLAQIANRTKAAQYDASDPLDVGDAFVQVFRNFG